MVTPDEAVRILNRLTAELDSRRNDVETFDAAYAGEHKLQFASQDFQEFFAKRYTKFSDNWCGIVADAPHERLEITGFRLDGQDKGDDGLWRAWRDNDADALSDLAFLDAIIGKRTYALVWGDAEERARITWEHPSQAIVSYDPETRQRVAGAKVWADESTEFATLYLPDSVWKFSRERVNNGRTPSGLYVPSPEGGWEKRQPASDDTWPLRNPLGVVPLVEYPNRPRLAGEPMSDIKGTLAMQHAINLLWSQMFLAADNASWPQRVVMGAEMPTIPILDENGNEVGERPIDLKKFALDRAVWLEDPNAKIGSWEAAKLDAWTDIIEVAVGHIAAQSRTPAHYMLIGGTIANVPEGGLKALETGLASRTREKTQHFGRAARETAALVALVEDEPAKADAIRRGEVMWRDVENRSDAQRADALQKKRAIGYPIQYLLELDGLPPQEIKRVMDMIEQEQSDPVLQQALRDVSAPPSATQAPPA